MNGLPKGWVEGTLADLGAPQEQPVLTGPFGANLGKEDFVRSGVPVFTIGCLGVDGITRTKLLFVTPQKSRELLTYSLKEGDLLFSRMASVGRVGFVPSDLSGALFNYHLMRVRLNEGAILPRFFFHFVRGAERVVAYLDDVSRGATRDGINTKLLLSMPISLPPLPEQRRIVAKIDSLTAKSRRARDHLDHIPRLVEKYKQAILAAAFRGDLTREWRSERDAGHWATTTAGSIIRNIVSGKNLRCEERPPMPHELGVVKVSAVTWGAFDAAASKTLPSDFSPAQWSRIRSGDLLISRANTLELVGAVVIVGEVPENLYLSDKILRLEMEDDDKRWLMWFLRSPLGRSAIESGATGNQLSMRNLSQSALRSIELPWPVFEERAEIVRRIETAFAWIDRLAAEATCARKLMDRLDQAVLAKAFRGELVPQDPADEPAGVLLERIRAERGAAPKARRGRRPAAEA